ncbi:MAG: acyl-ACP--UDP-N-acetylglucosamine O-acyltransferase [Hyphomonas sp.]|jgi:UDP-N-acetylglucosamine acyltransferase|nr:acyl-ACP--UDP-N-acetylglucosamine O-acyltransferase [Hyphomonas sp.]
MSTTVHPTAVIEAGAKLHDGVFIGPFCHVGPNVELGEGTRLISHASVRGTTRLGKECVLHPHAAVGGAPQVIGVEESPDSRLEIGDKCVFREYATAHTGWAKTGGLTTIGSGCFIMIGAHVAHDCHIGNNVVMANNVSLAGHIHVGDNVWFGGLAAVHQFSRIGRNAFIGGGAIVVEDVIPFGSVVGNHAKLSGLNTVGLKRRGFTKADLHQIRAAYKAVFEGEGLFKDRLATAAITFEGQALAMELIDFIREGGDRPICKPG